MENFQYISFSLSDVIRITSTYFNRNISALDFMPVMTEYFYAYRRPNSNYVHVNENSFQDLSLQLFQAIQEKIGIQFVEIEEFRPYSVETPKTMKEVLMNKLIRVYNSIIYSLLPYKSQFSPESPIIKFLDMVENGVIEGKGINNQIVRIDLGDFATRYKTFYGSGRQFDMLYASDLELFQMLREITFVVQNTIQDEFSITMAHEISHVARGPFVKVLTTLAGFALSLGFLALTNDLVRKEIISKGLEFPLGFLGSFLIVIASKLIDTAIDERFAYLHQFNLGRILIENAAFKFDRKNFWRESFLYEQLYKHFKMKKIVL